MQVARLNLHFLTAHYLKQQAKIRKKHNKLLNEEEARLARMRGDMQLGSEASDGAAGGIQHQVMKVGTKELRRGWIGLAASRDVYTYLRLRKQELRHFWSL